MGARGWREAGLRMYTYATAVQQNRYQVGVIGVGHRGKKKTTEKNGVGFRIRSDVGN